VDRVIFASFAQLGINPKLAGTHIRGAKLVTMGTIEPG